MNMRELIDIVQGSPICEAKLTPAKVSLAKDAIAEPLNEIATVPGGGNGTFWCNTSSGQLLATEEGLSDQSYMFKHHSQDVKYHPEKYGLDPNFLKKMVRNIPGSKKMKTARFDHDLMQMMFDTGWVRVNYSGAKHCQIQGSSKQNVAKALSILLDKYPGIEEVALDITPSLVKGSEIVKAKLVGADVVERFAAKGMIPQTMIYKNATMS